jgi:hypothetical protein
MKEIEMSVVFQDVCIEAYLEKALNKNRLSFEEKSIR